MKSPHPKCPVCYRKHDPRWTRPHNFSVSREHWQEWKISRSDRRLYCCWFNPKRVETYEQWEAANVEFTRKQAEVDDPTAYRARLELQAAQHANLERKTAALKRLANHPNTPPAEALAARLAIKRLSR
jgi:hypothetical protein